MNKISFIFIATAMLAGTGAACAQPHEQMQHHEAMDHHEAMEHAPPGDEGPERVAPRVQLDRGRPYLLSTNAWTEMGLKDEAVYLQFTDFGLKRVSQPTNRQGKDEGFLGRMFASLALRSMHHVLDHSIIVALSDTREAFVRNQEIILVTCKGKEVFNKVKVNDDVQKYPQREAEEFVRKLNRAREKFPACPGKL